MLVKLAIKLIGWNLKRKGINDLEVVNNTTSRNIKSLWRYGSKSLYI